MVTAPAKPSRALLPTGRALLAHLIKAGGAIPYHDPRVTISGLTALRHRGLACVDTDRLATVRLLCSVAAGRAALDAAKE